jgi:hypothetical protein
MKPIEIPVPQSLLLLLRARREKKLKQKEYFNVLEQISEEYRGSQEEIEDLKRHYLKFEGDWSMIMEHMISSGPKDLPRFKKMIGEMVDLHELPEYNDFDNEEAILEYFLNMMDMAEQIGDDFQIRTAINTLRNQFPESIDKIYAVVEALISAGHVKGVDFEELLREAQEAEQSEEDDEEDDASDEEI